MSVYTKKFEDGIREAFDLEEDLEIRPSDDLEKTYGAESAAIVDFSLNLQDDYFIDISDEAFYSWFDGGITVGKMADYLIKRGVKVLIG